MKCHTWSLGVDYSYFVKLEKWAYLLPKQISTINLEVVVSNFNAELPLDSQLH